MRNLVLCALLTGCGVGVGGEQINIVAELCAHHGGTRRVSVTPAGTFKGNCKNGLNVSGDMK